MCEENLNQADDFAKNFVDELRSLRGNFVEEILRDELNRGCYGADAKKYFSSLTANEQELILRALKLQEMSGGHELRLALAIRSIFPDGKLFVNDGKFLLYLPEKKSAAAMNKVELIKILFMDISNAEIDIYFERCFGVFGSPITMHTDEMILY
ncbi:MAG: hypothetical protein K6G55_06610 [Selenomonadaceae bacterium]|nr:hypothetical protein [Selenomonadaceae bacterium]